MRCGTTRRGRGFRDTVSQTAPFRKPHPTIQANSGMQFPDGGSWGNCIPLRNAKTGRAFRLRSLAEAASRNRHSDWDVFSRSSPSGETAARNLRPKRDAVSPRTESAARPSSKSSAFLRCMRNIQGVSRSAGNRNVPSCRQHFTATAKTRAGNRSHLRGFSGRSQRYATEAHVSYGLPNGTGTRCLSRLTRR